MERQGPRLCGVNVKKCRLNTTTGGVRAAKPTSSATGLSAQVVGATAVVGFSGFAPESPSPMRGVLDHAVIRVDQSCLGLTTPICRDHLLNDQPVCPVCVSGATSTCEVGRHGVNATRRHWDTAIRLHHRVIGMGATFGRKKTTRVIRVAGFGHTSSAPLDHISELHACNSYFVGEFLGRVGAVPRDAARSAFDLEWVGCGFQRPRADVPIGVPVGPFTADGA